MSEDLINSILDDLNDLMQDEVFCWQLTHFLEDTVLDELEMIPTDRLRDRIEKERHILRTLDYLRETRLDRLRELRWENENGE